MILVIIIAIIGLIVLVRVFFKSLKKEPNITLPNDYPPTDPRLTNPAFSAFGNNIGYFIFWDHHSK